jgi:hypothetical protein
MKKISVLHINYHVDYKNFSAVCPMPQQTITKEISLGRLLRQFLVHKELLYDAEDIVYQPV